MKKILIVGAGFSGAVVAEVLSRSLDCSIDVIDSRPHLGGNCYTERDEQTGVMVHRYGPHIFNTSNQAIWDYLSRFTTMVNYVNRVKATYNGNVYSMPVNLHTINQFFGKAFNPKQAEEFIGTIGDHTITNPENFEQQALKFIGADLYKAFFYGYTKKQWGCEPTELPASILKRLPVRFNYNDNYYSNTLQGIPLNGYTEIFENMLDHKKINISLNTKFDASFDSSKYDHVFYTGPIDAFFNYQYGSLGYRTVYFTQHEHDGDYQGNAVINYPDMDVTHTRIHEHKHFAPWEDHKKSVYFKEYSKETEKEDIPYYPKRLGADMSIYQQYAALAQQQANMTFLGRLATYRYLDMQHVIEEALAIATEFVKNN
jgi:UDP-galactopyranose mutase